MYNYYNERKRLMKYGLDEDIDKDRYGLDEDKGRDLDRDDVRINIHGYDSCSCPRCGSTDIDRDRRYCHKCGNSW